MKRFCAAFISILLILLCGCESPADFLSDLGDKLESNFNKAYDNISKLVSDAIPQVIVENNIDQSEIVVILPDKVDLKSAKLKAYNKLNSRQKKLYSVMLTAIRNMELKAVDITDYVSKDGFSDAVVVHRAIICDNPDIFWMPKKISFLSLKGKDNKYIAFKKQGEKDDKKGFFGITVMQKQIMQKRFDAKVNSIVSKASSLKNSFEKELYLHDYLCEHVAYDNEFAGNSQNFNPNSITAYGALVEGKAICEGYSKAMQLLCLKCGIPCNLVFGQHEGVSHMWNIINPGDALYYLDTTFDDSSKNQTLHIYFNVTKKSLEEDHIFDEGYSSSKVYAGSQSFNFFDDDCKAVFSNYYERNGAYIEEDCVLALAAILQAADDGKNNAELKNSTNRSLKSAFDLLCKKADGTVALKSCLFYDKNNVLTVFW